MDFKNTIVLTSDKKTKFLCQRDWILNVFSVKEKDFMQSLQGVQDEEKDVTYVAIHFDNFKNLALRDSQYVHPDAGGIVCIKLLEDFKILTGRLRGDKATEVLFGEKI